MLEAVRELRAGGLDAATVDSVTIRTHPRWLAVCNQPEPATGLQAKFSYRLTAAMMLAGVDTAALDVYSDAICARADLCALRDRVNVVADERLADSAAEVSLVAGGATRMARHDILEDSDPVSIEARLRAKAATLLGVGPASDLWARVSNLERAGGLVAFAAQIGGAGGDAPPI
jgi:hypothetical protein